MSNALAMSENLQIQLLVMKRTRRNVHISLNLKGKKYVRSIYNKLKRQIKQNNINLTEKRPNHILIHLN